MSNEMVQPVLEVTNLGIDFGGLTAVNNLDMTIYPNEIDGLIGPNGAGKTTVFNMLTKVYQPSRGTILLNGVDTKDMTPVDVSKAGIARTFQNIRLFSNMSVLDNVKSGMHNHISYSMLDSVFRTGKFRNEERLLDERAMELLEIFDLDEAADREAGNLPYGMQRRLEIARAMATQPKLLLLDEPAAGMNPQETEELSQFILKIRDQYHLTILLIEHHMNLVMGISDRIYCIDFGKLISKGTPDEVANDPKVIEAYLGVQEEEDA